jgi:GMP synthase (glutamine-hydrolysing)
MRPLCVVVTGDPIESVRERGSDWRQLIREAVADGWNGPWSSVDVRKEPALPDPVSVSGLVVTGSASSVIERAGWMLRTEDYLRRAISGNVPVFGICFGHQMLAQALGGRVEKNPLGREIGTVELEPIESDPLLADGAASYWVNMTHVDTVIELPRGARVLARTALDRHAAVRFAKSVWGVQFHPEIDGGVLREYVSARRAPLLSEGLDADAILGAARDTPEGAGVLRRFAERVSGGRVE